MVVGIIVVMVTVAVVVVVMVACGKTEITFSKTLPRIDIPAKGSKGA